MRGFIGLCLLITGLSIGAYSHYPGPAHRQASLAELTEIVTGAIHTPHELGTISRSANATELKSKTMRRARGVASHDARSERQSPARFQRRGWFANSKILAGGDGGSHRVARTPTLVSPPTRVAAHLKPKPRVLAIQQPPTLVRSQHVEPALSSGWRTAVVRVDAAPVRKGKRVASLKPKTNAERWKLVKSIQAELKRVGCYWGKVDGVWGKGSKWAMADFMKSVNAALPTKNPDYIQLQLISSHTTKICGRGNSSVQIAARKLPKVRQPTQWRTKVAHAGDATSGSRTYRVVTGALPDTPRVDTPRVAVAQQRRPAPLPGRMAVGVLDRRAPTLMVPPKRETRHHANVPPRALARPNAVSQQRVKLSALANQAPKLDLEGQQVRNAQFEADQQGVKPNRSHQVSPYVARKRSAAKARRARALRKATLRKKKRRRYRNRYRRRSVQTFFMHPLGRR